MRLPLTLNIQTGRKLADKTKDEIMNEVVELFGPGEIRAVQICYDIIRVTFLSQDVLKKAKESTGVHIFGIWCPILGGGPPVTVVNLFDYPFEETDEKIAEVFGAYGEVKRVRHQSFVSRSSVLTGTRLISLVLKSGHTLPRFIYIDGYNCRIWYRGQPLICNLCAIQGHKSANCPNKDKCRRCGAPGHFARACPNPWGVNPLVVVDPPAVPDDVRPPEPAAESAVGPSMDPIGDPPGGLPASSTVDIAVQGADPSGASTAAAVGAPDVSTDIENVFAQDLSDPFSSAIDSFGSQSILPAVEMESNKEISSGNMDESESIELNESDINLIELANETVNEIVNESNINEIVNETQDEVVLIEEDPGGGTSLGSGDLDAIRDEIAKCGTSADDEASVDPDAGWSLRKRFRDRAKAKDPLHHKSAAKVQKVRGKHSKLPAVLASKPTWR